MLEWVSWLALTSVMGPTAVTGLPYSRLVASTVHSTNPGVKLSPEFACAGTIFGGCGQEYDPWDLETYEDINGALHTYHRTSSLGNRLGTDQARRASFSFRGTRRTYCAYPYLTRAHPYQARV